MQVEFDKIDADLDYCRGRALGPDGDPRLGAFLTGYLLIKMVGEYDKKVRNIVHQWTYANGNEELATFVDGVMERRYTNNMSGNLKDLLNKIDPRRGEMFYSALGDEDREVFDNMVKNRNRMAHAESVNTTFTEIARGHDKAKKIIKLFYDAVHDPIPDLHGDDGTR